MFVFDARTGQLEDSVRVTNASKGSVVAAVVGVVHHPNRNITCLTDSNGQLQLYKPK